MAPARVGAGLPLTWLDVFTTVPLAGNALAVVHDADEVDDATMLRFARETRLSETTFVQAPTASGADYRNRIWMMSGELAFAGHPSLGTAVAVAHGRSERAAEYVQQTRAGLQPVEVERGGRGYRASMLQEPATFGAELDPEVVLGALGLPAADAHPELPAQIVDTGVPQVVACVADAGVLDRPAPRFERLRDLLAETGAVTAYLVHVDEREEHASARSFFAEPAGVAEDPATGGAAGTLMAYVHARTGAQRLAIDQGVAMGRPSRLHCDVVGDRVRVAGDVVVVAEGRVSLD
jgi:trans-2,3-dihydro-3-hydroxyanthranilate isomerase